MSRPRCFRFYLACLPLGFFLLAAPWPSAALPVDSTLSREAAPGFPFAGLVVVPGKEIAPLASNAAEYIFGTRRLPDPGSAQATFTLRNTANRPLTIERLQPTCRCTTAEALSEAGVPVDRAAITLPPGGRIQVRVTVILRVHAPGALVKSVLVFLAGHADPAARLDLSGTLLPEKTAAKTTR